MGIATARNQTVDQLLSDLLGPSTVVIHLSSTAHKRWTAAAKERGMTIAGFVSLQVESGIGGMFTALIEKTFYTVRALAEHHGVRPSVGLQTSTDDNLPTSTDTPQG
jgi:hypothetical protein